MVDKNSHSTDSSGLGEKNHFDHLGVAAETGARISTPAPLMPTNEVPCLDELHISTFAYKCPDENIL